MGNPYCGFILELQVPLVAMHDRVLRRTFTVISARRVEDMAGRAAWDL